MKFISVALVLALFCAVAISAAPSSSPFTSEWSLINEDYIGIADAVTKAHDKLIKKTKCTLDAIENVVADGELRHIYEKLRTNVSTIMEKDVKQCVTQGDSIIMKVYCILTQARKINDLYRNFIHEVFQTNKHAAIQVSKALVHCLKTPAEERPKTPTEAIILSDNEMTYGIADRATKDYNELIKKTKCALDAIGGVVGGVVGDGELKYVYEKLHSDVKAILENDLKQCDQEDGVFMKVYCILTQGRKSNDLYRKFTHEVLKTNKHAATKISEALAQCLKTPVEEPKTPTEAIALFTDDMTFGIADVVTKVHDELIKKTKCTLNAIENVVAGDKLRHVYEKLRTDVRAILENDVKQCLAKTDGGVFGKVYCMFTQAQKINDLYTNFIHEALKTNKDASKTISKALAQCLKTPTDEPKTPTEAIALFNNDLTFGIADVVTKDYNELIKMTKCHLDAIENVVAGSEFKHVYEKLRTDVRVILENDIKECIAQTDSIIMKVNCIFTQARKIKYLYANFIHEILKTNKVMAKNISKAQC